MSSSKDNYVVLGASGFIGSHCYEALQEMGMHPTGSSRSTPLKYQEPSFNYLSLDLLNSESELSFINENSRVLISIATVLPRGAGLDPILDETLPKYIKAIRRIYAKKPQKVVYTSSGGTVYGSRLLAAIEHPLAPTSPYGVFKATVENFIRMFSMEFSVNTTILRIGNPYGPRLLPDQRLGVIETFLHAAKNSAEVKVPEKTTKRDYIYIEDLNREILYSLRDSESFVIKNMGTGIATSINEVLGMVEDITGKKLKKGIFKSDKTELEEISLLSKLQDTTPLQEGMKKTWNSLQN